MPREDAATKGRRYLVEGRLTITRLVDGSISATCRGDSAETYRLGYGSGAWYCTCPAVGACSHCVALMLVTLRPLETQGPGPKGIG